MNKQTKPVSLIFSLKFTFQLPSEKCFSGALRCDRTNPLSTSITKSAKDASVFATTMVRPSAAINLNIAAAIWLTSNRSKYCLNSLQENNKIINIGTYLSVMFFFFLQN
uniref:Uncharacterized protein n=1 Tax=Triticum urartu TaxID=4572 RepID=A0A8R7V5P7_TRIUA